MPVGEWFQETFGNPQETANRAQTWVDNKSASFNNFLNYEGEGFQSWFLNKATRIGNRTNNLSFSMDGVSDVQIALNNTHRGRDSIQRMAQAGNDLTEAQFYAKLAQPGKTVGMMAAGGLAKTYTRGFLSAFVPMEPLADKQFSSIMAHTSFSGQSGKLANMAKSGLVKTAFKWLGPVVTGYRLGTETSGRGFFGGIEQGARIIGEEGFRTAGIAAGSVIGTALGGPVGTVAGMAVGYAVGEIGAAAWNTAIDLGKLPARVAAGTWNYFSDLGRQNSRANLGGQVSIGNASGVGYTMRQRALSQMNRSGINARSLLGQEAQYMHIR